MINTGHQYGDRVTEFLKNKKIDKLMLVGCYSCMMMYEGKYKYIRHFKQDSIE